MARPAWRPAHLRGYEVLANLRRTDALAWRAVTHTYRQQAGARHNQ